MSQDDTEELNKLINGKLKKHQEKIKYHQRHGNSVEKTRSEDLLKQSKGYGEEKVSPAIGEKVSLYLHAKKGDTDKVRNLLCLALFVKYM